MATTIQIVRALVKVLHGGQSCRLQLSMVIKCTCQKQMCMLPLHHFVLNKKYFQFENWQIKILGLVTIKY